MDAASAPTPGSPVAEEFALLIAALSAVPDFRKRRGRRHPLPGVLGLVVLGLMANCRSLSAISRYAQIHPDILPPLGLPRSPSVPTLSRVLAGIDPAAVRAALLGFTQTLPPRRGHAPCVTAIDGKSLRGVHDGDAPAHVLHVFAHDAAVVLDQVLVPAVRDEVAAAEQWIRTLAAQFPGLAVLTADALYADQDLCATIVAQDYSYLLRLKKNQRTLLADARLLFGGRPRPPDASQVSKGHGRLERRELLASAALAGYSPPPGLAQVAELRTRVTCLKTGQVREQRRYLVTSLPPEAADAERLLCLGRAHWRIENTCFHVRDDRFGEDRQVLQRDRAGAVLAALRSAAHAMLQGACPLWPASAPMTARAERVSAHPSTILATLTPP